MKLGWTRVFEGHLLEYEFSRVFGFVPTHDQRRARSGRSVSAGWGRQRCDREGVMTPEFRSRQTVIGFLASGSAKVWVTEFQRASQTRVPARHPSQIIIHERDMTYRQIRGRSGSLSPSHPGPLASHS